jgi:hypothetical protein
MGHKADYWAGSEMQLHGAKRIMLNNLVQSKIRQRRVERLGHVLPSALLVSIPFGFGSGSWPGESRTRKSVSISGDTEVKRIEKRYRCPETTSSTLA